MDKRAKTSKIFFGWWTVIAGGIITFWGAGYYTYGFSALFKPIASELGFSRTATSVPSAIGRLEGGIEGPLTGWISDRFGPRWIIIFGVFMGSLSLVLMNFIHSMWAFYLVWGVMLGTAHNVMGPPLDKALANWFIKKRGLTIGLKEALTGVSGIILLPLIAFLIPILGWRMTCVLGGVVMAFICFPLAWFFVKQHRPEYYGLLPDGARTVETKSGDASNIVERGIKYAAEVEEIEFTLRQAIRTPAYWLLIIGNSVFALSFPIFSVHVVPFLTDMGIDPVVAASITAIWVFASLPSRFVAGFLADHVKIGKMRFIIGGAYFLQAVGSAIFLLNQTLPTIYIWFILFGIGIGANMTLFRIMRARYFGRKAFGTIQGTSSLFMTPIGVMAPIYAGWVYDTTGSYIPAFTLVGILAATATVLMPLVRPPKPPTQVTDIHKIL